MVLIDQKYVNREQESTSIRVRVKETLTFVKLSMKRDKQIRRVSVNDWPSIDTEFFW